MHDERMFFGSVLCGECDAISLSVLHVDLVCVQCGSLVLGIHEVPLILHHEIEESFVPHLNYGRAAPFLHHSVNEFPVLLVEFFCHPYCEFEFVRKIEADIRQEPATEREPPHHLLLGLFHVAAKSMTVRHCERPQSPQTRQLAPLLHPEGISCHFIQSKRQLFVTEGGVMHHKELAETCCKAQEHILVGGFDLVLSRRKTLHVFLQRWVFEIIHQRGFYLHAAVTNDLTGDILFKQRLYETALWIETHIARIGTRLVIGDLQFLHQANMGRFLLSDP